ncbi:hypothetical protein AMECASPLE_013906 [Ameca splendens]|uniref:Uncharacterized protein n=1 Tax=Ameca splendens TaxID=208324 RepID=A0ABV0XEK3_9TELE
MKSPPKKVTMEEARKAHHIRWPLLSHSPSGENGMITFILDMWIEGSGLNFSPFYAIADLWSLVGPSDQTNQLGQKESERFRRFGELQPAPPDATAAQACSITAPFSPCVATSRLHSRQGKYCSKLGGQQREE